MIRIESVTSLKQGCVSELTFIEQVWIVIHSYTTDGWVYLMICESTRIARQLKSATEARFSSGKTKGPSPREGVSMNTAFSRQTRKRRLKKLK